MRKPKHFYVYIVTNHQRSHVLYTGITGDLPAEYSSTNTNCHPASPAATTSRALSTAKHSVTPATQFKGKKNQELGPQQENQADRPYESHWHDLAADWEDLYKPVNRTRANPHQILPGLTATQDDVK
jgi:hypothetical protein